MTQKNHITTQIPLWNCFDSIVKKSPIWKCMTTINHMAVQLIPISVAGKFRSICKLFALFGFDLSNQISDICKINLFRNGLMLFIFYPIIWSLIHYAFVTFLHTINSQTKNSRKITKNTNNLMTFSKIWTKTRFYSKCYVPQIIPSS